MHREVERPEDGEDAERAEAALGAGLSRGGKGSDQPQAVVSGDRRLGGAGLRLGARFPERLSDVDGDRPRQLIFAGLEHSADAPDQVGAFGRRHSRHRPGAFARGSDRVVDLGERPGEIADDML